MSSKRASKTADGIDQPSSKKLQKSIHISDESVQQAWDHYRSFLDSLNELEDEEAANIDEMDDILQLLSQQDPWMQYFSIQSLPICSLSSDDFTSTRSFLQALLSMAHLHIANDLMSQGFTNNENDQQENESYPLFHLEESIKYFPFNAAALSILANYKRVHQKDIPENICTLYERASVNARLIRELAISILNDESRNSDITYHEWVESLFLEGMTGVEYMGDGEDAEEQEEEDDSVSDKDNAQYAQYSTSDVESVSSFMAAMILSSLGKHDEALKHLMKFKFTHRIHPSVWEFSKGIMIHHQANASTENNVTELLDFEPKVFKGNVLPQELYDRLCGVFSPTSAYWHESDYQNRGYYSFFIDFSEKNLTNPRNLVEDVVINYLLPLVKKERPTDAQNIVGFEWWTHTRPLFANLGHPLHFDTDEVLLNKKKKLTHPIISSVLYLTGNKTGKQQTAGSTVVFNQVPDSKTVASKAYVCHALDNSYLIFPGNCLHGVLPCPVLKSQSDDPVERLTLMIGFWTRRVGDNIKEPQLYSPCGPLPPAIKQHSWVKEITANYPKKTSAGESCIDPSSIKSSTLSYVEPAWQIIDVEENSSCEKQTISLPIPCSLDHQFFVHGAPACFRDNLYKNESY